MRILVVESDDRAAAVLNSVLARHGFGLVRARTVAQALDAMGTRPDLVLLDLDLPDGDGLDLCEHIERTSNTPSIVLTARRGLSARIHGLNCGADDYLLKPFDVRELLARIHAIIRRSRPGQAPRAGSPAGCPGGLAGGNGADSGHAFAGSVADTRHVVQIRDLRIDIDCREVSSAGRPVPLTRKEFDLLAGLARAPGVVFRREQLVSEVWGSPLSVATRTLEVHMSSLRNKLGDPAMVQTVRGIGYRLVPRREPAN
jgi:DNA-binding response OmpR family regulator